MYGERMLVSQSCRCGLKIRCADHLTPQYTDIDASPKPKTSDFARHGSPSDRTRVGICLARSGRSRRCRGHAQSCRKPMSIANSNHSTGRRGRADCIVCADSMEEATAIARFAPNIIVAEPTRLIGTGQTSDEQYVLETTSAINDQS